MNNKYEDLLGVVQIALFEKPKKTDQELRKLIQNLAQAIAPNLGPDEIESIAREIETRQGIKAGLESVVDSEDFKPWLNDAKPDIDPFYWDRYFKLLNRKGLPSDVVISIERITEKILDRLGNP